MLDGWDHVVVIDYAGLSGFMSLEIDGRRVVRGWREWQTIANGAYLEAKLRGHILTARVTQKPLYMFSLSLDGQVLPGSDPQPPPTHIPRRTIVALVGLAIAVVVAMTAGLMALFYLSR